VAQAPANSKVTVKVVRDRKSQTLTIVLGEQPTDTAAAAPPAKPEPSERFGFSVQDLSPELREQFRLPAGAGGVVVAGVEENSPAAKEGIRPGDLILQANREAIRSVQDLARILAQLRRGANLLLLVQRDGNSRFVVLAPKE
jgi:serine protease Do